MSVVPTLCWESCLDFSVFTMKMKALCAGGTDQIPVGFFSPNFDVERLLGSIPKWGRAEWIPGEHLGGPGRSLFTTRTGRQAALEPGGDSAAGLKAWASEQRCVWACFTAAPGARFTPSFPF